MSCYPIPQLLSQLLNNFCLKYLEKFMPFWLDLDQLILSTPFLNNLLESFLHDKVQKLWNVLQNLKVWKQVTFANASSSKHIRFLPPEFLCSPRQCSFSSPVLGLWPFLPLTCPSLPGICCSHIPTAHSPSSGQSDPFIQLIHN